MELFNEAKNSSIIKIMMALNESINSGSPIARKDLEGDIRSLYDMTISDEEADMIDRLFMPADGDGSKIVPRINLKVPILPTVIETGWLAEMLDDPRLNGMLSVELKSKLKAELAPADDPSGYWQQTNWNNSEIPRHAYYEDDGYISTFKTCYKALVDKKLVYYESHDEHGREYKGTAAPYKLEYSITSNSFNFIMWNDAKGWTFKSDIATITKIKMLEDDVPAGFTAKADAYVEGMRDEDDAIVLALSPEHTNALTRCFQLFTSFEKQISMEDDGRFMISIYSRSHFDEEEILQNVLSLGSAVTVMSPPRFREKIIRCIQESFKR